MIYFISIIIPISIVVLYRALVYTINPYRSLQLYKTFYPFHKLELKEYFTKEEIIEQIRLLFRSGQVKNLYINSQYISFEDAGWIFTERNIYYIVFSDITNLHYRGTNRVYSINKAKLNTMICYLSKAV